MTPGGLTLCQLPRLSWWLPPLLPLSPLTPPLLSGCQGGVALSADVPRPAWRPLGSTASVSISHLYGFKRHRTDLYFTWEDHPPRVWAQGEGGLGLSTFPRPSCFCFQPITPHRTEGSLWLHWPTLSHKAWLGPGCRGPIHPHSSPHSSSGLYSVSSPMGYLRTRVHPPQFWSPTGVQAPHSGAAGCLVCGRTARPTLFTGPPHEAPPCMPCSRMASLQDWETMSCHLSCLSVASVSLTFSCLL